MPSACQGRYARQKFGGAAASGTLPQRVLQRGVISLRDAIIVAYYRGLYMGRCSSSTESSEPKGAMCAVGICETECKSLLKPFFGRAVVAAINSPTSCTLSGDEDAILDILEISKERGFFCRMLRVDMGKNLLSLIQQFRFSTD